MPMKINAIGLSGYAGAGKTEVAKHLERHYGCTRRHIAEPLRAMLRPLLAAHGLNDDEIYAYLEGSLKEAVIPELGVTSRYLQISLGTEWGRELISDSIWSDAWRKAVQPGEIAINDSVRFPNEQAAIKDLDGFVIRINRKGIGPAKFTSATSKCLYETFGLMWGVHPSERIDLVDYDFGIDNDGSLSDLRDQVDDLMSMLGFKPVGSLVSKMTPWGAMVPESTAA